MTFERALVERIATQYALPENLILAMVQVESRGNPWAMRYEPAFLVRYVHPMPQRFGPISVETERSARATSWGLLQIMGETARSLGYKETYLSALCDPQTGLEWGCKYLAAQWAKYYGSMGLDAVIAAYNAGTPRLVNGVLRNAQYVAKVKGAMSAFKQETA